ncbi:MAG TPA: DegT/DnrJ/EryC1/StrS family aminotransferase [Acidimicrobiia bacterium]|jgi:dTDP-4-amino-4,6-dideoxygalactose transaminase|nr:DegT/DnrJ/EryC1/StrS family aminotransferase [Acidimicrobiia bacterium]
MNEHQRPVPAARLVFPDEDRAEIHALIEASLTSGSLTLGPHTQQFEAEFARRHDAPFAIAVSSGTAAIEIVLRHLDVDGAEVVVPANTFFATAAAVVHAGGRVRLADVDASTLALSAATVEAALTPDTAGVVMVHIGGVISPEVVAIRDLCARRGLFFVEDAAHAHGAAFDGVAAGRFGVAGAFSFYPTKVITAAEGGMIVTADERLRDDAVVYRDQGKAGFLGGDHVRMGAAWRMSELHAAVGLVQQRRLDEFIAARRAAAARYDAALADLDGIAALPIPSECAPNYYKYVAMLDHGVNRDALKRRLREAHGVSLSGEVYAAPLHRHPVFHDLARDGFPVAEDVCARQVCLPVHSDMTATEADRVVDALRSVLPSSRLEVESVR